MLLSYESEIEGMIAFWNELGIAPDYELNTDGRYNGNLLEFKRVFTDMQRHKEQIRRYIKAYNSCALPIPKWSYLISINEREYVKIDNETGEEVGNGNWNEPKDFLDEFQKQNEYIKGWIDEYSITAYNNRLCTINKKSVHSKEDVKDEFINPRFLYIYPFDWDGQLRAEEQLSDIGWLHFNMNMLGPDLLKKQLGAFFTPSKYVKIATEMVREAIARVPKGNDYIIFDRCAGTGNLEKFLYADELSHCVLNTYDYTEWTTLKGLYDGRVRMIIPPTRKKMDFNFGLLNDGDALSEEFYNFCFNGAGNNRTIFDGEFEEESIKLSAWLHDEKMTVIMLENPPFAEPQGGASQGKPTFTVKDKYLYKEMGKRRFETKNTNRATENLFIWSAFEYFLRQPTDSYILFSPIKYWKSQHLIDRKFIRGHLCDREKFNASKGGIALIEWSNEYAENTMLEFTSDLGNRVVNKIYSNPLRLLRESAENPIAYLFNLSNIPKTENGKLINDIAAYATYCKTQKAYRLGKDNILTQIPLWVANCYDYVDYTEIEVIMKTADGGNRYAYDKQFLYNCFLWAGISQMNKCLSRDGLRNEFCFGQNTTADELLAEYELNEQDRNLYDKWIAVLDEARRTEEYDPDWTYGLKQIGNRINIKIPSGALNKKGEPIMRPKYRLLDESISILTKVLKSYYSDVLKPKLFEYELLK